jgi:ceroid-lipofuscinosis MFS transporter 7
MLPNRTPKECTRAKHLSIAIVGFITFVGDSARGVLYPALWPQCQYLGGNSVDLGFLVSTFSIGRMVVSTRMGILTDRYRHRYTLMLSTAVLLIGVLLWANCPEIGGLVGLYAAQFLMGVGWLTF